MASIDPGDKPDKNQNFALLALDMFRSLYADKSAHTVWTTLIKVNEEDETALLILRLISTDKSPESVSKSSNIELELSLLHDPTFSLFSTKIDENSLKLHFSRAGFHGEELQKQTGRLVKVLKQNETEGFKSISFNSNDNNLRIVYKLDGVKVSGTFYLTSECKEIPPLAYSLLKELRSATIDQKIVFAARQKRKEIGWKAEHLNVKVSKEQDEIESDELAASELVNNETKEESVSVVAETLKRRKPSNVALVGRRKRPKIKKKNPFAH